MCYNPLVSSLKTKPYQFSSVTSLCTRLYNVASKAARSFGEHEQFNSDLWRLLSRVQTAISVQRTERTAKTRYIKPKSIHIKQWSMLTCMDGCYTTPWVEI